MFLAERCWWGAAEEERQAAEEERQDEAERSPFFIGMTAAAGVAIT